ncbi:hypothetical protein N7520_004675 [Penicillium odoratum]|uniref:uncharacterized protein n=1 Tax=Penicillium odoratum TaxID=1167516 RepID=UPI002546E61D|nr:uncharacterized protein N7520_010253 [Penicillium odoratum]XP_056996816.1 uncharacterized protein N7520_004675 [Penicillium odoratum]KAJ5745071.1 hypothetical protein N7520_010253 [Penicillium odoratum]KAJ5765116.1 hypothetical protein N7520_004675 [Penicillium odoratum]
MPRPQIDLAAHRDEIQTLFESGATHEAIQHALAAREVHVTLITLRRRLDSWGFRRYSTGPDMRENVKTLLPLMRPRDVQKVLPTLTERTFRRIRAEMGVKLRTDDPVERDQQREELQAVLTYYDRTGEIEGYGRRAMQVHLRRYEQYYPADLIYDVYREIRPDAVLRRTNDLQRGRGSYSCPGANFVWHVDGHMKLEPYGFEIYAAIDGYSRKIMWIYTGISARTAVSVGRQYLDCIQHAGCIPRFIRCDLGVEGHMMADFHLALRRVEDPTITRLRDCFLLSKSTENQRIESFWSKLQKTCLFIYRHYFMILRESHLFSAANITDQVALLAIYMPLIRRHVSEYIKDHNSFPIRPQKNRLGCVTGIPLVNYDFPPPGKQYKCEVSEETYQILYENVAPWDPIEYLPPATLAWCSTQLNDIIPGGFDPENPPLYRPGDNPLQPYRSVYEQLRIRALDHEDSGMQPKFSVCDKPLDGYNWRNSGAAEGVTAESG